MAQAGYAFLCALAIAIASGPIILPVLQRLKFGQQIRQEGPQSHLSKKGTPTMGGVIFLLAAVISSLVFAKFSVLLLAVALMVIGHAALGFIDDYIKVVLKRSLGLRAKQKLVGQIIIALVFALLIIENGFSDRSLWLPVVNYYWQLGSLYYLLVVFMAVGVSNAVNLTDGVDGLASSVTIIVLLAYGAIFWLLGQMQMIIVCTAFAGSLLGFLKFNSFPAKVFMGDTGSLALGGLVAALSIISKTEIILAIAGIIYVLEALSVMIQVSYFKYSGGKRIFRMSPLHHHFELGGWREVKIVRIFTLVTLLASLIAVGMVYYGKV